MSTNAKIDDKIDVEEEEEEDEEEYDEPDYEEYEYNCKHKHSGKSNAGIKSCKKKIMGGIKGTLKAAQIDANKASNSAKNNDSNAKHITDYFHLLKHSP